MTMTAAVVYECLGTAGIPPGVRFPLSPGLVGARDGTVREYVMAVASRMSGVGRMNATSHTPIVIESMAPPDPGLFINRPGVFMSGRNRIVMSHRAVLEWGRMSREMPSIAHRGLADRMGWAITDVAASSAPRVVMVVPPGLRHFRLSDEHRVIEPQWNEFGLRWVNPVGCHETWLTMWMSVPHGSHGDMIHGHIAGNAVVSSCVGCRDEDGVSCFPGFPVDCLRGHDSGEFLQSWLSHHGMSDVRVDLWSNKILAALDNGGLTTEMLVSASLWGWSNIIGSRGTTGPTKSFGGGDNWRHIIARALMESSHGELIAGMPAIGGRGATAPGGEPISIA